MLIGTGDVNPALRSAERTVCVVRVTHVGHRMAAAGLVRTCWRQEFGERCLQGQRKHKCAGLNIAEHGGMQEQAGSAALRQTIFSLD